MTGHLGAEHANIRLNTINIDYAITNWLKFSLTGPMPVVITALTLPKQQLWKNRMCIKELIGLASVSTLFMLYYPLFFCSQGSNNYKACDLTSLTGSTYYRRKTLMCPDLEIFDILGRFVVSG